MMIMRTMLPVALALVAAPAWAASPFDGTWKANLAKIKFSEKPDEFLLANGIYSCKSCTPPVTVPADGRFHPVSNHDYFDAVSVKVLSPAAVEVTGRKGEGTVFVNTLTASADGSKATIRSRRTNTATGVVSTTLTEATRAGVRPAGAHAVSGRWLSNKAQSASANAITQTIKVAGDAMTLSTPTGEGYTATFGGPAVVQANDPARTMISLKKLSDHHVVETDTRGGKPVMIYDMTVSPNGKSLTMAVTDPRSGSTDTIVFDKI